MSINIYVLEYDSESREASVKISDGEITVIAYCHPFEFAHVSSEIALDALFVENIYQTNQFCLPQKAEDGYYSYHITAEVFDRYTSRVKLGSILLSLDKPLPKDIPNGAYIEFDVGRLDLTLEINE